MHITVHCLKKMKTICFPSELMFLVLETTSNLLKKISKGNPGQNLWNKFCSIIESNAWMRSLPTPSNNLEVSLHILTTLFIGVRGECLTCTCLFVPIYFGQDCRLELTKLFTGIHYYLFWWMAFLMVLACLLIICRPLLSDYRISLSGKIVVTTS